MLEWKLGKCLWLESETHFGWEQVPERCQDAGTPRVPPCGFGCWHNTLGTFILEGCHSAYFSFPPPWVGLEQNGERSVIACTMH